MQRVPVIAKDGQKLMPTKPSKARKLTENGKAIGKFNKLGVYYIQLTFEPSNRRTQPISCGIDPGKKFGSVGIQSSQFTLFTSHIFLPFETVKKRVEQRALMRRSRRGRRINRKIPFDQRAHRQCRFSNRKQSKIPPSIKSNCQLLLRVVTELSKVYPINSIVYEYCKADVDLTSGRKKAKSGKGFSPVMVGQAWIFKQLANIAPVIKKLGWQTSNLRNHIGLAKQKHSKGDITPFTHAVDAVTLASFVFIDYLPFENSGGRGHCWQGKVAITDAPFFVIRRPPISKRQLHLMRPAKDGKRRKYGGTTTPFDIRKGDLVRYKDKLGYCSGYTGKSISVSDANWKRLGRYAASKIQLVQRSTNLICTQRASDKNIIGGTKFPYVQA